MTGPLRSKTRLWRESSKGIKSRFTNAAKDPPLKRDDVRTSLVQDKINRGGILQRLRLSRYPSIDVDFSRVYAGSIEGDKEEAKNKLMQAGFRNGPLAYVEVTDRFGPDDGSFWLHVITETGKFPFIENRTGLFRRVKDQIHVVVWEDPERSLTHLGAHREQSALLQPARHTAINDSNAMRGERDLRNKWIDTFGEELPRPLEA
jgi:hypothetical protein